jgi:hypothetical protein
MMHPYFLSDICAGMALPAGGIKTCRAFCQMPFVPGQPVIIFRINEGKFSLRQRDSSKGTAVAIPAV